MTTPAKTPKPFDYKPGDDPLGVAKALMFVGGVLAVSVVGAGAAALYGYKTSPKKSKVKNAFLYGAGAGFAPLLMGFVYGQYLNKSKKTQDQPKLTLGSLKKSNHGLPVNLGSS